MNAVCPQIAVSLPKNLLYVLLKIKDVADVDMHLHLTPVQGLYLNSGHGPACRVLCGPIIRFRIIKLQSQNIQAHGNIHSCFAASYTTSAKIRCCLGNDKHSCT